MKRRGQLGAAVALLEEALSLLPAPSGPLDPEAPETHARLVLAGFRVLSGQPRPTPVVREQAPREPAAYLVTRLNQLWLAGLRGDAGTLASLLTRLARDLAEYPALAPWRRVAARSVRHVFASEPRLMPYLGSTKG